MLNKIIIINSQLYAKAEINLEDAQSIQLVGENNVGKSSLVNTLNFLYITEGGQMRFEGNRRLKDSLKHYFPSFLQSYILFEIEAIDQQDRYVILVKRTKDNDVAHYYIPHAYMEALFFMEKEGKKQVLSFDDLQERLMQEGIECRSLNRDELYQKVYHDDKLQAPALLLSPKAKRKKGRSRSNAFTQIYKYLIHSLKISADDLTDMLITASHTEDKPLTIFAESGSTNLNELDKLEKKAQKLAAVKPAFETLKEAHTRYDTLHHTLGKAYYTFCQRYPEAVRSLKATIKETAEKQEKQQQHLKQLTAHQEALLQECGRCQSGIEQEQATLATIQDKLKAIKPYDSPLALSALQSEVADLEAQRLRLRAALYDNSTQKPKNKKSLQADLARLTSTCQQLETTIASFSDTLIQHISADPAIRKKLNSLLGDKLLYLPKKAIKKKITQATDELTLFDGKIDISSLQATRPFTTTEELHAILAEKKQAAHAIQQLLENQEALSQAEAQWQQRYHLLGQVQAKQGLLDQQKASEHALDALKKKHDAYQTQLRTHKEVEQTARQTLDQYKETQQGYYAQQQLYTHWRTSLAGKSLPQVEECLPETELNKLYELTQSYTQQVDAQRKKRDHLFHQLSLDTGEYTRDPAQFIEAIEQQLEAMHNIEDKKKAILDGVINSFVTPTYIFLDRYKEFKKYVEQFSRQLAGHHISGIEHIEICLEEVPTTLEELESISRLQDRTPLGLEESKQDTRLQVLRRYIAADRTLRLKDLFKLRLKITKKDGYTALLDIGKQMESYGTDKVLRLFIFLMLLKEFFVTDEKNRVVIYVDEVGTIDRENVQRILTLCAQYHVLPIFASTSLVEGFSKYYLLLPSAENQGKLYIDDQTTLHTRSAPTTTTKPDA